MTDIHVHATLTTDLARRWDDFADRHPGASLYHRTRWVMFASEVFGFESAWITGESTTGELFGLLPMIRQRSRLFGERWVSLPYFNYGGPLALDDATAGALIRKAGEHARQTGVRRLEIRDVVPRAGVATRTDKAALVLDLPDSQDALAEQLGSKLRSQTRRADREQPQVVHGGAELLAEFYGVFAETMRDLGTPVLARRFFEEMFRRVGGDCRIVIVRLAGQAAAAAVLTMHRGTVEIPWAGNRRQFRATSVNMRLYWECLQHAIEGGYRRFDFGRSTIDSGTYRFKRQWGAKPVQLHWLYPLEPASSVTAGREGALFGAARAIWRRLPVPIATALAVRFSSGLPW
jgi:FemAB-related protein (PEP-CTERM system-associated)